MQKRKSLKERSRRGKDGRATREADEGKKKARMRKEKRGRGRGKDRRGIDEVRKAKR